MKLLGSMLSLFLFFFSFSQAKPFQFAFISDTHIGSPDGKAEEDLRRTVADINSMKDRIAFVVITGDITELGTDQQLQLAKQLLDSLQIPYYIIPGNHDTGWSESGGLGFTKTFGSDRFSFRYQGINFVACASGPYVRMSDGHVPRDAMNWLAAKLKSIKTGEPVIFLNHYPLDSGLDNWYQVIDLLKTKNTVLALCGHGHANRPVKAEGIPSIMGRSNLRAKEKEGGYNLVAVREDSIVFMERKPFSKTQKQWIAVKMEPHSYDLTRKFPRPDFSINQNYPNIRPLWTYSSSANVISTPAVIHNEVVFGNQTGWIEAVDEHNGKRLWRFKTNGPIFSSPAVSGDRMVVGSADDFIYCLDHQGKLQWKIKSKASVLGSPVIEKEVVYLGGSDHHFTAYRLSNGRPLWTFAALQGPVVSQPVIVGDTIIFGAWDRNLYALDTRDGHPFWTWNNGSSLINYSPAACIPVVKDGVVYIAAPDRYLSAIDIRDGKTLWRTGEAAVRESIGISNDGKLVYGKTMQDTVVAFYTDRERPRIAWKMNVGFGYEHTPSMLIEKNGRLYFGTRNGVVYCINPSTQKIVWAYKIDNSMVNTLNVLGAKKIIASTMDGKVCLLQEE